MPGSFEDRVVVAGWSQGGGAALSAQALASTYGAGGTLAAVVAFAPEWPIRDQSFDLEDMLANPDEDIAFPSFSYSNHAVWAQRAYAYFANFQPGLDPGSGFPSATRAAFMTVLETACGEIAIGAGIYGAAGLPPAKFGELFDPDLRVALLACMQSGLSDPGCTGVGRDMYTHFSGEVLTADAHGAPILFVQGLADTVLPPASEGACIAQKLVVDGADPTICVDPLAQHTDVTNRNVSFAIDWVESKLGDTTPPDCPTSGSLPTCD